MPTPPALRTIGSRAVRVGALVLLFIVLNLPSWATPHAAEAATVTELAKLVASDGAAGDGFGYSIAIDGDSAVMGAHGDGGAQGAAYVFIRDGDTWSQQAKLTASDGAAGDFFGISVAISGDSVLVGAYGDGGARGAAYVFTRSGTTWSQQAKLTASDGEANHHFGNSVAVSGDTAVVGAHAASFTGLSQTGTAYVYVRSGGTWSGQQKLNPSNSEGVHEFGISVAISGDTAVVGAHHDQVKDPGQEEGGILGQGAAHVFVRSGDTWSQQAKLVASDGEVNDNLGISVAISGDTVVAGAYTDDVGGNVNQGAGYVFMRSGTTWSEQSKLTASDGAASDFFGNSVGVSRDTAMAGAFGADTGGNSSQGAAYVFALAGPLPVVFVPGVAGSILIDRADGNKVVWLDPTSLSALEDMSLFDPAGDDIVAPDVLREVTLGSIIVEKIYGDFLDGLADKGFREYDLNTGIVGDYASFVPERLTSAGCDSDQTVGGEKPNLFLFPYDWRLDNAVNAQKLNDYIDCVRQFYPDSDVNVVTHSMGSLLTRRYVLDNPGEHHVSRWVSIGAPWLGAPKLAYVLETGEFVPELAGIDTVTSILKDVLGSFHAAHQLLPSKAYFELGAPATILEFAVDMDGNGEKFDSFASDALYDLVDARYGRHGFTPGTTAKNFHTAAQDDWRTDSSGIEYFHIIGVKSGATTIARFTGHMETVCEVFTCSSQFVAVPRFTVGDGTVPRLSAERIGNSLNYNAPDATRLVITSPAPSSDGNVDHNGMMNYSETTRIVLDVLAGGDGSGDAEPFPTNIGGGSVDYHYVKLIGPASITVLSGSGGSTAALNGVVAQTIPGIEVLSIGENAFMALIPAGLAETYDLKFFAPGGPIRIEVLTGDGGTPDAAIRYADLVLPEGATSTLAFSLTGVANLAYDSDGNGTLDATAAPTANLTGAAAADAEGPVISVSQAFEGGLTQVTLSATDAGSGVAGIFFSTDGAGFEEYTGPFTVNPSTVPTIYAFANDNAANRSTLVQTLAPPPAPVPGPTT